MFSQTDDTQTLTTEWRSGAIAMTWYLSALLLIVFGGGVIYATVVEVRHLTRVVPPAPQEVAQDVVLRNAGDGKGRRASFRIMLLTDDFRWRLSSTSAVERAAGIEFSPEMKAALNDAKEIICVGASSEELPNGVTGERGRAAEERRAAERAEQIARWVKAAIGRDIPVRKLNVGYHAPTGELLDTSDQRRVVIILVLERENNTNIDQALRAAMTAEAARTPIFDALLTRYSLASGTAFNWVD